MSDESNNYELNTNSITHGLYEDKEKLWKRLDPDERRFVVNLAKDLLSKFPEDETVGAYERAAIRNLCLDVLKRDRANEFIVMNEMTAETTDVSDKISQKYHRIVKNTTNEMEKMGLLEDGPAMTSAENMGGWMDKIEDASSSTTDE